MIKLLLGLLFFLSSTFTAGAATLNITVEQVGSNVLVTGSGAITTSGFPGAVQANAQAGIRAQDGSVVFGPAGSLEPVDVFIFNQDFRPVFGTGGLFDADAASGDSFAIVDGNIGRTFVAVPLGYVSETNLFGEMAFYDETLTSLGIEVGSYLYTVPGNEITLTVKPPMAAVPLPSSFSLFLLLISGLVLAAQVRLNFQRRPYT